MRIIRKATGRVIDKDVKLETVETVLNCLPFGVYDVEDSDGRTVAVATVKRNGLRVQNVEKRS